MNTAKVAEALNTISVAFGELAEALSDAPQAPVTAQEPSPFVDLPDEVFSTSTTYEPVGIPAADPVLSVCPNHGTPWSVKAAGVSKAGKAYSAFFKCDGKNPDGTFCQKKPTREWADAHAARLAAA